MISRMFSLMLFIWLFILNLVLSGKTNTFPGGKNKGRNLKIEIGVKNGIGSEIFKWLDFKRNFKLNYTSKKEEQIRQKQFEKNKLFVEKHNKLADKGKKSYRIALNKFADKSQKDLSKMFGSASKINFGITFGSQIYKKNSTEKAKLPSSVDLRDKGFVTPVQDQTFNCIGSWAFAATGALEGHYFRKSKTLIPLSPQFLISCGVDGNDGCHVGDTAQAFKFVKDFGYKTEKEYPYLGDANMNKTNCPFKLTRIQNSTSSYFIIKNGDEEAMKEVIANIGPIAVKIIAQNSFILFRGDGIYSDFDCNTVSDVDSFVQYLLILGYGTEKNQDYWLVKNSMGVEWGENGYIKIARNNNMCRIADFAYYPIV